MMNLKEEEKWLKILLRDTPTIMNAGQPTNLYAISFFLFLLPLLLLFF